VLALIGFVTLNDVRFRAVAVVMMAAFALKTWAHQQRMRDTEQATDCCTQPEKREAGVTQW
jgi:hypothetical protein